MEVDRIGAYKRPLLEEEEKENSEKQFCLSYQTFDDDPTHVSFDVLPVHTVSDTLGSGIAKERSASLREKALVFHLPE